MVKYVSLVIFLANLGIVYHYQCCFYCLCGVQRDVRYNRGSEDQWPNKKVLDVIMELYQRQAKRRLRGGLRFATGNAALRIVGRYNSRSLVIIYSNFDMIM